jgi:hypothetical protein
MVIYTVTFAFPLLLLIFFFLISHGSQYEIVPQTQSAGLTEPVTFACTVLDQGRIQGARPP